MNAPRKRARSVGTPGDPTYSVIPLSWYDDPAEGSANYVMACRICWRVTRTATEAAAEQDGTSHGCVTDVDPEAADNPKHSWPPNPEAIALERFIESLGPEHDKAALRVAARAFPEGTDHVALTFDQAWEQQGDGTKVVADNSGYHWTCEHCPPLPRQWLERRSASRRSYQATLQDAMRHENTPLHENSRYDRALRISG